MEELSKSSFTVFFDEAFWIGVFERIEGGKLSVCKVTFGAEPTDAEIYTFLLSNYSKLKFSKPIKTEQKQKADNPKRRIRNAKKMIENKGIGTKSQQALKMQYEEMKTERKLISKEQKEAAQKRQFELKQQKRKEKHKGH